MIVEAALWLVRKLLDFIFGILPVADLNDLFDTGSVSAFGEAVGEFTGPFNQVFPVSELASLAYVMLTVVLPIELAFGLARFAYRYIPFIGK